MSPAGVLRYGDDEVCEFVSHSYWLMIEMVVAGSDCSG
jgi:hypothetical protein